MKPGCICYTEEGILSPDRLPEYMRNSRYFRIEYRDPVSGFNNYEGKVLMNADDPNIYERLDLIRNTIAASYGCR